MIVGDEEILIKEREIQRESLIRQLTAATNQLIATTDRADQEIIKERISQLENEMRELSKEINQLRLPLQSENVRHRQLSDQWEEDFHKIDYRRVGAVLNQVFRPLKRQEGSALFLIQKGNTMGGKLCVQKIKHAIQGDLGRGIVTRNIGFPSHQIPDIDIFLSRLEEYYIEKHTPEVDSGSIRIQTLTRKIFDSLQSGQIFCIELELFTLSQQSTFLESFVNDFWLPFINQLASVSNESRRIRLIGILSVLGSVPESCLPETICHQEQRLNDRGTIIELPLERWTETDISDWLFDFSGLNSGVPGLTDTEIFTMAQTIHSVTEGVPKEVYNTLMDAMTQCAS